MFRKMFDNMCPDMVPGLALRVPRGAGRVLPHGGGRDLRPQPEAPRTP